ncbi:hypothetical protein BYT27DRAFT_6369993 [Phlegmacium glaucopus]|nr:hypothetical protein BYT27DRAFT_6369993 [Phlegmacium glaucopus]
MQSCRILPPLNLDRATFQYDSLTGQAFSANTQYLYEQRDGTLYIRDLSTTTSSSSLVSPMEISPMSAPPHLPRTELSSLHSSGKKTQNNSSKIWKIFTRKPQVENSCPQNPTSTRTTPSDNVPAKNHKSPTHDLKEPQWRNFIAPPCHGFSTTPPSAPSAAYFVHTPSERDIPNHPTMILVDDDNRNMSSAHFPIPCSKQTIPVDITDEENSEYSSHPSTNSQRTIQYIPIRGQRRRAEASKSNRGRRLKKQTHDPDASFLDMDVIKPF